MNVDESNVQPNNIPKSYDPEYIRQKSLERYHKNRDEINENRTEYARKQSKKYYEKHKVEIREKNRLRKLQKQTENNG